MLCWVLLLSGCAGPGSRSSSPDYPSQGVVRWQGDQAQIPAALIEQINTSFARLQRQAGNHSRLLISAESVPNAFATVLPQGPTVVLNAGLIDMTGWDADELAFVLGHELAHLELGHLAPGKLRQARTRDTVSDVIGAIAGAVIPFGGLAVDVGNQMIKTSFSRDQERDADRQGLQLMIRAGFDPRGALRFHRKLLRVDGGSLLPFLSTHPSGNERIRRLESLITELSAH